ncbi:hypothetical protein DPMN_141481 [Dreissena polymorpha]|uniref:Uncharacterized protein n=1 Tax=Dreissena polymorpha TaxID=45954 RepID=A0A9D4JLA9_DREPO|nr:hypothetical protein DPMN_141481 [Dreissena polymorpha]
MGASAWVCLISRVIARQDGLGPTVEMVCVDNENWYVLESCDLQGSLFFAYFCNNNIDI